MTPRAAHDDTPGSGVWLCGQTSPRRQRAHRFLSGTTLEPDTMLPEIARHAMEAFTRPGDVVGDPVCGVGTSLIEATHAGRHGVGIEANPRRAHLARLHLDTARTHRAPGRGNVLCADARQASRHAQPFGRWQLLLTRITAQSTAHPLHGPTPSTLDGPADRAEAVLAGVAEILTGCLPMLAPAATIVLVTRDHHHRHQLTNFPARLQQAAESVGLRQVDHIAAVRAKLTDHGVVARPSGYDLSRIRAARAAGHPLAVIAHDDVLVFTTPDSPFAAPTALSLRLRYGHLEYSASAA